MLSASDWIYKVYKPEALVIFVPSHYTLPAKGDGYITLGKAKSESRVPKNDKKLGRQKLGVPGGPFLC